MELGFVGLGRMGGNMVRRLSKAGTIVMSSLIPLKHATLLPQRPVPPHGPDCPP